MSEEFTSTEDIIVYDPEEIENGSGVLDLNEYYHYYDLGNITDGVMLNDVFSGIISILAHKSLAKAIENDMFDENASSVTVDTKVLGNGVFSAYIVPRDIPKCAILKNDIMIIDLTVIMFRSKGLYIVEEDGKYYIKYLTHDECGIVAGVSEIQRYLRKK